MTLDGSSPPPGWYPDPGAQRQWRIWNGREWTDTVRDYGDSPVTLPATTDAVRAHDVMVRYGVLAYWGALALAADAWHHRVSTTPSMTPLVFDAMIALAIVLFGVGHVAYSRAVSTLTARPSFGTTVPFVNTVQWARLVFERANCALPLLHRASSDRREGVMYAGLIEILIFVALWGSTTTPLPTALAAALLIHCLPALGYVINVRWARALRDDLAG